MVQSGRESVSTWKCVAAHIVVEVSISSGVKSCGIDSSAAHDVCYFASVMHVETFQT